jgi:hypothetical protein
MAAPSAAAGEAGWFLQALNASATKRIFATEFMENKATHV